MLCQSCQMNTATTHIKSIVNGELTEYALCPECAKKMGYGNLFHDFTGFGLGSFLGGFFGESAVPQITRCGKCGSSFEEISHSGKVSCAECYRTFRDQLLPSIQRIHGTARHQGKRPGTMAIQVVKKPEITVTPKAADPLEEKKQAMQKAIETQDFERAAVLRDEIRAMEGTK